MSEYGIGNTEIRFVQAMADGLVFVDTCTGL